MASQPIASQHSAVAASQAKAKKPRAPRKKASAAAGGHPPFIRMIIEGIQSLKERKGSSRQALLKFIVHNYGIDEKLANQHLKRALRAGVASGDLVQKGGTGATGRFRVGDGKKAAAGKKTRKPRAKKAASPKKPRAAKPKKAASPKKRAAPKARKAPAAKKAKKTASA